MVQKTCTDCAQMDGQEAEQAQERMQMCPGGGDDTK